MLTRRTPLRSSATMKRKRLKPVGRIKQAEIEKHAQWRRDYLAEFPWCEASAKLEDIPNAPKCGGWATEIHERLARSLGGNKHLTCPCCLVRVCRPCHRFITDNPLTARIVGLAVTRADQLKGDHAPDCRGT